VWWYLFWACLSKVLNILRKWILFFLTLSLCSQYIWLVAKQPITSVILAMVTDLLGFAPTIRKSWSNPYTETLSFYVINSIRFILATISLQNYSMVTALYPISWFMANGLFAIMLQVRRRHIGS